MYDRAKYKEDDTDLSKIQDPAASVKHDGANFFMVVGPQGNLRFFSRRKGVKGNFPERTAQLPQLTQTPLPQYAGNVYNVELVHTGHSSLGKEDHPKLSGILNSLPAKSIQTQQEEGPVRAIMLNVISPKMNTYGDKLQHMKEVSQAFNKPEILKPISVKIGRDNVKDLIDSTKKMGQEGVIVTSLTTPEDVNVRHKVKHVNTWNLKVKRINQEFDISGNPKQSAGSLTVVDSTGREVADVGTGFSRKLREEIFSNPHKWINKEIQVKARNPSRRKLLAPVYNGEPDGSMDKVAATLEDQLLSNLVSRYQNKGISPQKILDNPLFQQLPLEKKVAFIEQYGPITTQKPNFDYGNIGTGVVGGGIGGAIATTLYHSLKGGRITLPEVGGALISGAMIGGTGALISSIRDRMRDNSIREAATDSGVNALVTATGTSPVNKSPFGVNKYLRTLEGMVDTHVPNIVTSAYGTQG